MYFFWIFWFLHLPSRPPGCLSQCFQCRSRIVVSGYKHGSGSQPGWKNIWKNIVSGKFQIFAKNIVSSNFKSYQSFCQLLLVSSARPFVKHRFKLWHIPGNSIWYPQGMKPYHTFIYLAKIRVATEHSVGCKSYPKIMWAKKNNVATTSTTVERFQQYDDDVPVFE